VVLGVSEKLVFEQVKFPMIVGEARKRRRVTFPEWLLADKGIRERTAGAESDSQPEDPLWEDEGAVLTLGDHDL
jgi:hypothetical protein